MNALEELGVEQPVVKRRIPSKRNREVFTQVMVRERSRTEVGKEFGLTQPRVTQIIEQVQGWLTQVLGADGKNWTPEQRLRYAENATAMKLDYQYGEAIAAWHKSLADRVQHKERHREDGTLLWTEKITTTQCGKSSHLGLALRLTLAQAKLAGVDVTGKSIRDAVAKEQAARETLASQQAQEAAEVQAVESAAAAAPLEVCDKPLYFSPSQVAEEQPEKEPVPTVTPILPKTCDEQATAEPESITAENSDSNPYETFGPKETQWSDFSSWAENLANDQAELNALEANLARAKSRLRELVGAS